MQTDIDDHIGTYVVTLKAGAAFSFSTLAFSWSNFSFVESVCRMSPLASCSRLASSKEEVLLVKAIGTIRLKFLLLLVSKWLKTSLFSMYDETAVELLTN